MEIKNIDVVIECLTEEIKRLKTELWCKDYELRKLKGKNEAPCVEVKKDA